MILVDEGCCSRVAVELQLEFTKGMLIIPNRMFIVYFLATCMGLPFIISFLILVLLWKFIVESA